MEDKANGYDFFWRKRSDKIYISKPFPETQFLDVDSVENPKLIRIVSKVFDQDQGYEFATEKKEIVLRVTPAGRQEVKIVFYEDSRAIKAVTIQRFSKDTNKPIRWVFTFKGSEIDQLYNLLGQIKFLDLDSREKFRLDDEAIKTGEFISDSDFSYEEIKLLLNGHMDVVKAVLNGNVDMVKELLENDISLSDIAILKYRKKQLEIFGCLLNDPIFFEQQKDEWNIKNGSEAVWQKFFEQNTWIFGYGLSYIFTTPLGDKKLEQVVSGFNFSQSGKRTDALLKTRGLISSLCFVEVKTHETKLLKQQSYRSECWPISEELAGGVSQIQTTVQKAVMDIQPKTQLKDGKGFLTGEEVFLYQPKSILVIGRLDEFIGNFGVNDAKYCSFELFRKSLNNPEIITFDELFERATFIVKAEEKYEDVENNVYDEIPF